MEYRKIKLLIIITIFFIIASQHVSNATQESKNILFISSYNPNYITFNDQISGIKKSLGDDVFVRIEYMDFKNYCNNKDEKNTFYNLIEDDFKNYGKFDAVILADDLALQFGIKHRYDLFKDTPVVFLGASYLENIEQAKKLEDFYGLVELPCIEHNLKLISKFHSGKNVIAITDSWPNESPEMKQFYSLSSKYKNLNFKHLSSKEMNFEQMKKELSKLDDDDVVLLTYLYRDKSGNAMGIEESSKFIEENTNVPSYCVASYSVKNGFIGGRVISHYEQGSQAGLIVKDLLENKKPKEKVINRDVLNKYVFNYEELQENKIRIEKLPQNSKIIHDSDELINKYNKMKDIDLAISICFIIIIVVFVFYILKKQHYEKVLLEAKELAESANKTKNHFISNISHELRTPVAVIMSSNQLLELNLNKIENEYSNSNENNMKIIRQNCFRLLRLTNNIIDIAKVDSGFMNLKLCNIDIISFLEGIVESVLPFAQSRKLNIIFDTTEEELIMSVDLEKIERIVLNLISNAIKFSHENNYIYVSIETNHEIFVLSIKDYGIGIEEKFLNAIFERFTQVDDTMIRKNEGSGIGLSIVKSFVELHGGNVKVKSKINEGSEFIVELPIIITNTDDSNKYFESWINENTNVELSDIYF
ncbi:sensor histidine kinase [Romboutsia sp.]|uniref:sensor histidine kinase n=1 Tax=Romboutsia sp. TaxID=1965302 RepID=UPI003F2A3E89